MHNIFRTIILLMLTAMPPTAVMAQRMPFIADGLINTADTLTLGLPANKNVRTVRVFSPTDCDRHYANGAVLTVFKNAMYCMWQSSTTDEDAPETCVVYSRSNDEGLTWSEPQVLAAATDTAYCTSGGWMAQGDSLTAFINVWPTGITPTGGYTYCARSSDGRSWTAPRPVMMADGSRMNGVIEQDFCHMPDGRMAGAAHMQPGLHLTPIFTDDTTGCSGWHTGTMATHDRGRQSQELEPSIYMQPDRTLVMVQRDQKGSYRKMASVSRDRGATWTEPMVTNIPDARVKQSAGNLADGTAFLVGNTTGAKRRFPLVALFSADGACFDRAILLRSGGSDLQSRRYPGKAKTIGYNYPKSIAYNGCLYVAYTTNKEDVEVTVVSME